MFAFNDLIQSDTEYLKKIAANQDALNLSEMQKADLALVLKANELVSAARDGKDVMSDYQLARQKLTNQVSRLDRNHNIVRAVVNTVPTCLAAAYAAAIVVVVLYTKNGNYVNGTSDAVKAVGDIGGLCIVPAFITGTIAACTSGPRAERPVDCRLSYLDAKMKEAFLAPC